MKARELQENPHSSNKKGVISFKVLQYLNFQSHESQFIVNFKYLFLVSKQLSLLKPTLPETILIF